MLTVCYYFDNSSLMLLMLLLLQIFLFLMCKNLIINYLFNLSKYKLHSFFFHSFLSIFVLMKRKNFINNCQTKLANKYKFSHALLIFFVFDVSKTNTNEQTKFSKISEKIKVQLVQQHAFYGDRDSLFMEYGKKVIISFNRNKTKPK